LIVVDSYEKWQKHKDVFNDVKVVGIDAELVPCFIKWEKEITALYQVATSTKVIIFDFLSKDWEVKIFAEFVKEVICNGDILKLGVGLKCDLKKLSKEGDDLQICRNY